MAESNVADDDEEMWYEDAPTAVEKVEKYEEKQKNGECTEERVIQETKKKFLLLAKSTSRSTAYSRVNTAEETMSVYVTVCEFLGAHFRDEHLCGNLRVGRLREATGLVEVTLPPGFTAFQEDHSTAINEVFHVIHPSTPPGCKNSIVVPNDFNFIPLLAELWRITPTATVAVDLKGRRFGADYEDKIIISWDVSSDDLVAAYQPIRASCAPGEEPPVLKYIKFVKEVSGPNGNPLFLTRIRVPGGQQTPGKLKLRVNRTVMFTGVDEHQADTEDASGVLAILDHLGHGCVAPMPPRSMRSSGFKGYKCNVSVSYEFALRFDTTLAAYCKRSAEGHTYILVNALDELYVKYFSSRRSMDNFCNSTSEYKGKARGGAGGKGGDCVPTAVSKALEAISVAVANAAEAQEAQRLATAASIEDGRVAFEARAEQLAKQTKEQMVAMAEQAAAQAAAVKVQFDEQRASHIAAEIKANEQVGRMAIAATESTEAMQLIGESNASLHQNFHQLITSLAGARLNGQASNAAHYRIKRDDLVYTVSGGG